MFHDESKQESYSSLTPKVTFIAGLVIAVLSLLTIGFFLLLAMFLHVN